MACRYNRTDFRIDPVYGVALPISQVAQYGVVVELSSLFDNPLLLACYHPVFG